MEDWAKENLGKYISSGKVIYYRRVCVKKSDFFNVRGFDKRMIKYGFEDYDFVNWLELAGVPRSFIEDFSFLKFISHDQDDRFEINEDNLKDIFIMYLEPSVSELLILYKDKQFKWGLLINNDNINSNNQYYAYQPKNHRYKLNIKEPAG